MSAISGTPTEDQTLTASNTLADADGLGVISYQWQRDGVDIAGATASTYTLLDADVGATITVVASYTDGQGTAESVSSAGVGPIANMNDAPTGSVTISGIAAEGQILTASNTLADADGLGAISYQWLRDGVAIGGATASTYTLGVADIGTIITVTASYTDGQGTAESVSSVGLGPIGNVNDAPVDLQTTATTAGGVSLNEDGGNDIYFVADDGAGLLGGLTTVTIEVSFSANAPVVGDDLTPLLSYADGANDEELAVLLKSDGRIWFGAHSNGSVLQSTVGNYMQLYDGATHNVGVSWDSSNGAVAFYIDGQLVESFTGYQTGQTVTGGGELVFGQDQDSVLGGFKDFDVFSGTLHDVRIFNDVRTAAEIAGSYDQTLPSTEPGMIANWTFSDLSTGGVITDTVSGNNLTEQHVIGTGFTASTPDLTLAVQEDAADGTVIGSLSAIDPDSGDTFTYTLLDNAGGRFAINSTNGQITLADSSLIDFESSASHNITARVTDAGGLTYDEVFTIYVLDANDAPVGVPTITGIVTEDQVLTADTSGISDDDGLGAFSYQWLRDGVAIGGATGLTYTLGDADVGAQISVQVSYTDGRGTSEGPLTSTQTAAVANVNDAPVGLPTITGTVTEDQILTADTTGISDVDGLGAFSYQWLRDGVAIGGATSSTYTLGDADVGTQISVQVSYTDGQGTSEGPLTSAQTAAVTNVNDAPVGLPTITGTATEDQLLTADTSGISDADGLGAFSYQWLRDGVAIAGATSSTYTLGDADVGTQISVQVSYTDGQGTSEGPLTSAQTAVVTNINDAPTGSVNIAGIPTEDQVLTASNTLADADGLGVISYQWQRDGVDIAGATASTYTLDDADVGATITVAASYTDGQGTAESVSSAGVGPIANVNDAPVGAPTVTGTVTEDQLLTADTTGISDADGLGAFSYQWYRDGVAVGGATGSDLHAG